MPDSPEFDVVVIGAGPTGENVAARAVQGGLSAALIERELVGGECSYWACMPSKAMLRPVHALAEARSVEGASQAVTGRIDAQAVLRRRDSFTHAWDDSSQVQWAQGAGITLLRGRGRLVGEKCVEVLARAAAAGHSGGAGESSGQGQQQRQVLKARSAVVIATGSDAAMPPVPGLAESAPWTSRDATSAKEVPGRLVVMGGGVVGCEMAQVFGALGSEVTIVERGPRLVPGVEERASEMLARSMQARGITVMTGCSVQSVEGGEPSGYSVGLGPAGSLQADRLLVAVGRVPRTGDIGLSTVGLTDGDWLHVDDSLLVQGVSGQWLYAAGDVNHRALLTHQGKYQARACGDAIVARAKGSFSAQDWGKCSATADHRCVPQVIFTDPEISAVGLTEAAARQAGISVKAVEYEMGNVAGAALYADGYEGWAKMVVDQDRHVVVGATFVGSGAGELVHAATIAVVGEVPLERLWHAVPSYPTISEVWLRLLESYGL
ncbi:MAG TPA: NAD(P)/FAD-dependent oxidoreductase [Acidimicrobiales bacterium]|nr:NAD(P)/FAD-dependent oxidoreductase [Acidimicrobiales bacterium]